MEIEHPAAGKLKYPGPPFRAEETPWDIRRPAPLLGEHNKEILSELGYIADEIVKLKACGII